MQTRSDNIGETESTFAPVPTWERSAKRNKSLFGARKPAATHTPSAVEAPLSESSLSESSLSVEPRSFAPATTKTIVTEPTYRSVTPPTVTSIDESPAPVVDARDEDTRGLTGGDTFAAAPIYASQPRKTASARKGGVSGMAIAAGVAAVGVIAAGAWYASQPRGAVETITPSTPVQTASMTAPAAQPAAPLVAPVETAQAPLAATVAQPVRVARAAPTRAAAATSADEMGMNASATLPASPIPYGEIPQVSTGGTVAPAPVPASTTAAMTPAAAAPATVAPAQPTPVDPTPEAASQPGADMTSNPTP